jgi:DNA repair protein RadC
MVADLALIDGFEKIRGYLLGREPGLEQSLLARPADTAAWKRLAAREYQEALLAAVLDIDRRTAAERRAVRWHLQRLRESQAAQAARTAQTARIDGVDVDGAAEQVSEGAPESPRTDLLHLERRERLLRKQAQAIAAALELFALIEGEGVKVSIIDEIARCNHRRPVMSLLRRRVPLLDGLRAHRFLEQIGFPVVVPDPARQHLFERLGWIEKVLPADRFPREFFELCERLIHLTGEPWAVVNAATGLFAGSYGERAAAGGEPLAVCTRKPRCGACVLQSQCAHFRYRGEPDATPSRSVKNMAWSEQPRTRFEALGPANLSEVELLALVLRTGAEGLSSVDLAREIITRFGNLEAIARAGLGELCQVKGVGRAKAIEVQAALELGRRLQGGPIAIGEKVKRSADLYAIYRVILAHEQQENFYLVVLNTRNRIQNHFLISRGSLTSSPVHPREVMKAAIRESAAAIAFIHNHPSGEVDPSEDDRTITHRLVEAAKLFGIRVLDHVIIGRDGYFSFADHHLL